MKYIGYYDCAISAEKRHFSPAAVTKMDYLRGVLLQLGHTVEIISLAPSCGRNGARKERLPLDGGGELVLFSSFGFGCKVKNHINETYIKWQAILYLLRTVDHNETIIVYHSMALVFLCRVLHRLSKLYFVCDIGELYSHVLSKNGNRELSFFRLFDAFIVSTQYLDRAVNAFHRPYVVMHGTYHVTPILEQELFQDGKIHCVYAGTFDPRKGVLMAIKSAASLDEHYHIHILGFGLKEEVDEVTLLIDQISRETPCTVTYEGILEGDQYLRFLQKCQIGLSPQSPEAAYNMTSFPSKILSYLSNGLKVVSIRIPAIEQSDVGAYLFYYDNQTPEEISDAIKIASAKTNYDGRAVVRKLDLKFRNEFCAMLESLKD